MTGGSDMRGIALDDYTKTCPPGWQPYMHNYPLKLYKEKLSLWLRITDVEEAKLGPTILGRIKGPAYRIIMKMRVPRQPNQENPNGYYVTADAAVAAQAEDAVPAVEAWQDNHGNVHPARPGIPGTPSGVDMLIQTLEAQYGELETDQKGKALDRFFDLHRMNGALHDYCTAFRLRYETAQEQAGLGINDVAKTHLFLKNAGITNKYYDEIMMKVDFDRTRFETIANMVAQMGKHHQTHPDDTQGHILLTHLTPRQHRKRGRKNERYPTSYQEGSRTKAPPAQW